MGTNDAGFNTLLGTYGVRNPYCFRAYDSAGTTLTDGTEVKITLGTEEYDYNSNFASSTYTCPVAGVYHFQAQVISTSLTGAVRSYAQIRKNGSGALYGTSAAPPVTGCINQVSGDILCAAGDTIEFYVLQDTAANETSLTGSNSTWFAGHLVHAV